MKSLRLRDRVFIRKFESRMVYDAAQDELYEIDDEAFEFLLRCNGKHSFDELKRIYGSGIDYVLSEGIVEESSDGIEIYVPDSPAPSLRYILIHITNRCNLKCRHCYVDKAGMNMEWEVFKQVSEQFYEIGGIKMMITGGEPLMHPEIENVLKEATGYGIRVEVLTNGTLIDERNANLLKKYVDEVQISIDGIKGHDMLRGKGSLEKSLKGIEFLKDMDLTVATMITRFNSAEFDEIEELVSSLGAKRWLLDYPCTDESILPPFREAAEIMRNYGFGKESYESSLNKTCGTHLCAVTPGGMISRCGFYEDKPVGSIGDGLRECWDIICSRHLWDISELECRCKSLENCRGGCRYRAEFFGYGRLGKDPLMCNYFGEE